MKEKVELGTRVLLGLIFTIFGANGLVMVLFGQGFIPMPQPEPEVMKIMGGLFAVKYLMPSVKILEVISGLLLLSNRFVPLALLFLGPIIYNILGVHIFVDPSGLPMAIVILVLYGAQLNKYKDKVLDLLIRTK